MPSAGTSARELLILDLGLIAYDQAHAFQRAAARLRVRAAIAQDLLILCEHPQVVTTGRSTKSGNLKATAELLATHGIELRDVERGGDVTIHEPGQLVGYPVIDLKRHTQDLHWYLRQIEEAIIHALRAVGLDSGRSAGQTGVWIDGRKLASIGVHAREWVTSHGFALNAFNSLDTFRWIVPCGIADVTMTTVARECETVGIAPPDSAQLREAITCSFARIFMLSARTAHQEILSTVRAEMLELQSA